MKPKIFVSSTVYDLIDIRAEVEDLLREMGMEPLLSDSATSDFQVCPDKNSIETCLVNVRASDYAIVILSKRYGPKLGQVGYKDISATHLEYREAIKANIPVFFYVRDRLESDFSAWKKNKRKYTPTWVKDEKDSPLFDFMEEHRKLTSKKGKSNWYQTFRNSVDLKNLISRDLRLPASKAALEHAIRENRIPIFGSRIEIDQIQGSPGNYIVRFIITNYGTVPAYNVLLYREDERANPKTTIPVVAPGMSYSLDFVPDLAGMNGKAVIEYYTPEGHKFIDKFMLEVKNLSEAKYTKTFLYEKKYIIGEKLPFFIEDESNLDEEKRNLTQRRGE